jgi:16S rRNA processing protein RimM
MLASKIKVGRILAAHGLRGEVKLQSFTSQTQDLFTFHPIVLGDVQIAVLPPFKKTKRPDVFIVPLGKTREEAEALVGQCLWVCPSQLPKLAAEEFYYAELLDRPVYGHEGDLEGHVLNVHNFGAGDI